MKTKNIARLAILSVIGLITLGVSVSSCTRIETGEVGLRIGFDKQIDNRELYPGSFNQTLIGSVLKFPVKELSVQIENKTPLTNDNSTVSDFDMVLVYSINPDSVSELWSTKNKSFHNTDDKGQIYLMENYLATLANNATFKSVRGYKALDLADNRAKIENEIKNIIIDTLKEEKLDRSITISLIQIKNITLDKSIIDSANAVVTAQNQLKTKEIEVNTAKQEALRIEALNANSKAIEYMNTQANLLIAQGIKEGKVQTVVVPYDFKGMINIK